jgi:DNA-binding NarL/FixJ family response regulator
MNRLDELPHCEGCGASLTSKKVATRRCADCRRSREPRPPGRRELDLQRTRVMRAQGFTERQIADALGVRLETVKMRLRRARERGAATQKGAR